MHILFTLMVLTLIAISIFDLEYGIIPHSLTIIFLIIGVVFCILLKEKNIVLALGCFFSIFISQFILFCIYGENSIGGGDIKLLTIGALFLHNFSDIYNFCLFLTIVSVIGFIIAKKTKKTHLRYGPYISIALITTVTCRFVDLNSAIVLDLFIIEILLFIDSFFFLKNRVNINV